MFKEKWYELDYEDADPRGSRSTTVLYTSKTGLDALIVELVRIQKSGSESRQVVDVPGVDKIFDVPFTHVEIRKTPLEQITDKEDEDWGKPFIYFGIAILIIGLFAMYGLVRIVMDVVN